MSASEAGEPMMQVARTAWVAGPRARRALRALGRLVVLFLLASIGLFLALEAMPEDPVSLRVKNPDPERVREIRQSLGLDDPMPQRYLRYVGGFLSGEWGRSLINGREVRDEVASYLPATIELSACAMLLGVSVGVMLALGAHWSGSPHIKRVGAALGSLGLTVPIFWIGLVLIVLFAVRLEWLPVGGRFDFMRTMPEGTGFLLWDSVLAGDGGAFRATLAHLALPVITLALYPAALVAGTLQARLDDPRIRVLVRALRAKGFSRSRIWFRHVLRLISAPVVTIIGTNAGALLGGAVLTETVFSWPGMGRFIVEGVLNRDFHVIANGLLLVILMAFAVVAIADILAGLLDPQSRRGREAEA